MKFQCNDKYSTVIYDLQNVTHTSHCSESILKDINGIYTSEIYIHFKDYRIKLLYTEDNVYKDLYAIEQYITTIKEKQNEF